MEIVRKKQKIKKYILIAVLSILINTAIIFLMFNKKIMPNVEKIASSKVKKITYALINDNTTPNYEQIVPLDKILDINQNSAGEIVHAEIHLNNAYILLDEITKNIKNAMANLQNGTLSSDYEDYYLTKSKKGLYLNIPIGLAFGAPYLSNFGPIVPVGITFSQYLVTNLKTKITNYGLNNALVELYVYICLNTEIITPTNIKEDNFEYNVLIAAQMINGRVPSIYGSSLENESGLINIPLN